MTRSLAVFVTLGLLASPTLRHADEAAGAAVQRAAAAANATAEIRAVLDRYVKAVNDADENLLRELWAQPDQVSYVNPMQRLRSWGELQGFWQGFLKNTFTRRDLRVSNVTIETTGDAAWVVVDWEFTGTLADGKPQQSRGWETQVYRRTDRGWRIAHVHYSVPAAPPPGGQGAEAVH